jgi:ABC-2 type transport system permease protein
VNQLASFFRFELRYHLRRPVTYVFAFVMALLGFLVVATDAVRVGGVGGKVMYNSPWLINSFIGVFTLVGTVFTSAIAGTAILRDFELKSHELLFTTRLQKSAFVFGRFLGAYLVTLLVLSCAAVGLWLGLHMPWLDADKLGPTPPGTFLWPLLLYVVPTGLFVSAVFFAVGVLTRSYAAVYSAGIVLFVGWQLANIVVGDIEYERLAALIDPFALHASDMIERHWTIAEKNTLLLPLEPLLAANRALWLALSGLILAVSYRAFRMEAFARAFRSKAPAEAPPAVRRPRGPLPPVDLVAGPRAALARLAALVRLYYRGVLRDRAFLTVALCGMAITTINAFFADMLYGTTVYPVTYAMIEMIRSFDLFFLILTAMYAGELVWRDRQVNCDQLLDATPASSAQVFAGKLLALVLVHATLLAALIATGVAIQTIKGYTNYELGVYLGYLYGIVLPGLFVTTAIAFFLHVLADNKHVGTGLVIGYYLLLLVLGSWGVTDNLFRPAGFPDPTYSAMNGYGPDLGPWLWFYAYYFAFAGLLLLVARLFVVRGRPDRPTGARALLRLHGLRARLRLAKDRLSLAWLAAALPLLLAFAGLFAFIRHNTHTLNIYRSSDAEKDLQAEYERAYKQYEKLPQPRIVASDVRVELYPARGHMTAKGRYRLANKTGTAIDRVHVGIRDHVTIRELAFDRPAELEHDAPQFRYQIYKLAEPLAPGAEMALNFDVGYLKEGFGNTGRLEAIVDNGSFLAHNDYLPMIGYLPDAELADDDDRKERGLPDRERMRPIDDQDARRNTYIASDSDWIDFAATVCTEPDQIALAPGYLEREWTEEGDGGQRRCFAYEMDSKILNFYSFLSARYAVRRDQWNDVAIEIYYHPGHEYNTDRMIDATKKSLDYFTKNFSPYQHRQVRILEFPRYASFAQSFPNTIPYSEAIGFIARVDPDDPEDLDYPFYVTAHEVAHQWWAHQVIGADVQGATMLSESLSQYSALMVMEKEYGKDKMKKFLGYELKGYLGGRSGERKKELPLMLNENQQYIHYQKGSLVFYALKDYIGEDTLNAALARYIKQVGFQQPPFTTTRDLVAILREATPPEYQYVIEDMFETITLYDNKVTSAEVAPDGDKFRVRFEVQARKLRADELGNETEVPIADYIDIGVFAPPGPGDLEFGKPLFFERRKLTAAKTEIEVVVDAAPARVGIDPYNKLIDRDPRDNTSGL